MSLILRPIRLITFRDWTLGSWVVWGEVMKPNANEGFDALRFAFLR